MGNFRSRRGMTLIELIVATTIMMLLTYMAVPMARSRVRREKERDLRLALREIENAIDQSKTEPIRATSVHSRWEPKVIPKHWRSW